MKAIKELKDRLRNEMVTRMEDQDVVDILEVLQDAEEELSLLYGRLNNIISLSQKNIR